ncbi:hypothetical protein SBV1_3040005 [Verrucomicrobia bacterium]|nr:hypothetical protein SBV1_3040005 [Verrucomicrobiota bacterium]
MRLGTAAPPTAPSIRLRSAFPLKPVRPRRPLPPERRLQAAAPLRVPWRPFAVGSFRRSGEFSSSL